MSGSEQFLGRQLTKQALALESLVEKMTLMIQKQDQSIPKFSIASDVMQHQKAYNHKIYGPNNIAPFKITPYVNGQLRLKINAKCDQAGIATLQVLTNGVVSGSITLSTVATDHIFDVGIMEGDTITFILNSGGYSNVYMYLTSIKVCYDLSEKPNVVI